MPKNFEGQNQEENLPQPENQEAEKSELTFKELREEDFDEMLRIRNEAVAGGAPMGNRRVKTKEEYFPELYKALEESRTGEAICLGAEKDGQLAGWIGGGLVKGVEIPTAMIGVAILRKGARGFKNFITGTSVENRARTLYKRLGFKEAGIRETENGQYVNMEKDLD